MAKRSFSDIWSDLTEAGFDQLDKLEEAYHERKEREERERELGYDPDTEYRLPDAASPGPFAHGKPHMVDDPEAGRTRIPRLPMPMLYDHLLHAHQILGTALITLAFSIPAAMILVTLADTFGWTLLGSEPVTGNRAASFASSSHFSIMFFSVFMLVPAVFAVRIGFFAGTFLGLSMRNLLRYFLIATAGLLAIAAALAILESRTTGTELFDLGNMQLDGITSFVGPLSLPAIGLIVLATISQYAATLRGAAGQESTLLNVVRAAVLVITVAVAVYVRPDIETTTFMVRIAVYTSLGALLVSAVAGTLMHRIGTGY